MYIISYRNQATADTYEYIQNNEGLIPTLTYDYQYDTVTAIIITGSRGKSYWINAVPSKGYVLLGEPTSLNSINCGMTAANIELDTINNKISFNFGYSYGKNNGDPSHTIYIFP